MSDNDIELKYRITTAITEHWAAYEKAKLPIQKVMSGLTLSDEEVEIIREEKTAMDRLWNVLLEKYPDLN